MKKIILLFTIGLISIFTFGQGSSKPIGDYAVLVTSDRDGELDCSGGSIYSQSPLNSTQYLSSDEGGIQVMFENFSGLSDNIAGLSFWGILREVGPGTDCYSPGPQDFEIKFYQDNAGEIGTLVQTFSITVTPSETGSFLGIYSLLRYDVTLPSSFSLATGWFSVVKLNPGASPCRFSWANTTTGDNNVGWSTNGGTYIYGPINLSFCLTTSLAAPPVPISNWALGIGLLLISGFIIIRFRRRLA